MNRIRNFFKNLFSDVRGLSAVEYLVVAAVIGGVAFAAISALSAPIQQKGAAAKSALGS